MDGLELKPMQSPVYSEPLGRYLEILDHSPVDLGHRTIFGALLKYIQAMEADEVRFPLARKKATGAIHPVLKDFIWAIESTVQRGGRQRMPAFQGPVNRMNFAAELCSLALQFEYEPAIDFLGELAGAWVLTYPMDAIRAYALDLLHEAEWITEEEDYQCVLRRDLDMEVEEWTMRS